MNNYDNALKFLEDNADLLEAEDWVELEFKLECSTNGIIDATHTILLDPEMNFNYNGFVEANLTEIDPTHGKYVDWLMEQFQRGEIRKNFTQFIDTNTQMGISSSYKNLATQILLRYEGCLHYKIQVDPLSMLPNICALKEEIDYYDSDILELVYSKLLLKENVPPNWIDAIMPTMLHFGTSLLQSLPEAKNLATYITRDLKSIGEYYAEDDETIDNLASIAKNILVDTQQGTIIWDKFAKGQL